MNYLVKIKKFLLRYSKKEKGGKPPKMKEVKQRTANTMVYGMLGFLFLVGFFGALRAIGLSNQVNSLKATILSDKQQNQKGMKETLDISRVQYYMNNFVYTYINYSDDTATKRKEELDNYYSFSTANLIDDVKKERKLQTQRLISIEQKEDYHIALMRIGYEVDSKSYQMTLAIPFRMANGLLAIVSPPYTLAEDLFQGKSKSFERKDMDQAKSLSKQEVLSIQKFLPIFFDKYALSNEIDLKLLMKHPELMGGNYRVKSLDVNNARYYQDKSSQVVQLMVTFEDMVTGGTRSEHFTLYLIKSDNGWYVDKLYHYFK
ncbi:conjugal transfer protein [Streptococcus canis]|uniref:conjugal transfer protein n=1 Tax=Streptococcus canis TaxID=1329 RepID=UPI001142E08E|nr:conjugal transfer protein [Streptococcus canis]QKG76903.1 conjugal transfer protein [Streptococcus canis]GEE06513.1 conjugal transfer protein [Streptococcus canis]GFG41180.1 conjugal transfer protein [Streptococcus canis]GMX35349.1 conjugal transfer protein [Streptococcus canis]GMX39222.1 conjugal transfer protein [Streptococcus canis]